METLRAQLRELQNVERGTPPTGDGPRVAVAAGLSSPAAVRVSPPDIPVVTEFMAAEWLSLPFFLARLRQYLQKTRPQLTLDLLAVSHSGSPGPLPLDASPPSGAAAYLLPDQEAHALSLFWQSHYFSFPVINEGQFWRDYRALVAETEPSTPRRASPLVDIVLALCLQLASYASGSVDSHESLGPRHPGLAGLQYYRRCQDGLDQMIENPTVVTVQCYVFSVLYLYEAGLINRAQVAASKGITTATMLGLQHESRTGELENEKELRRRTWWALYAFDARLAMETGRPPIIAPNTSTCNLPSDAVDFTQWLAPHYQHNPSCPPWTGFQTQALGMFQAVKAARTSLEATYAKAVGDAGHAAFIEDAAIREECARCVASHMERVYAWAKQVPKGHTVLRKEGEPFSTDRSVLDLSANPNILVHCQRQRLLLELHFHCQCMGLYQSFTCFASPAGMSTPVADGVATTGVYHAMALTSMMHEALTKSDALSGVYHVFRCQRVALFTMLGYAYSFPLSSAWFSIRSAIDMAIAVIGMYQNTIPEAAALAATARALSDDVSTVVKNFLGGGSSRASPSSATAATTTATATAAARTPATPALSFSMAGAAPTTAVGAMSTVGWPSDLPSSHLWGKESNGDSLVEAQWFDMDLTDDANAELWNSSGDMFGGDPAQWWPQS